MADPTEALLHQLVAMQRESVQQRERSDKVVLDELSRMSGEIIRLNSTMMTNERNCELRHKALEKDVAHLTKDVEGIQSELHDTGEHNVEMLKRQIEKRDEDAKKQIEKRDEDTKYWIRYVVTAIAGLVTGAILLFVGRMLR